MVLTTHAIVGAGIAGLFPNQPITAVTLVLASHYLLDTIPHYDYKVYSAEYLKTGQKLRINKFLLIDVLRTGLDFLLGSILGLVLFATKENIVLIAICILVAVFPDFLQLIYARFKIEPLKSLQRFHEWIHAKNELKERLLLGIVSQALILIVIVSLIKLITFG